VNLGDGVNSPGIDVGPSYFENEGGDAPLLFFSSGPTLPTTDIYVSQMQPDGSWGTATLVPELSSPASDQRPSVRFDGLERFLFSTRPGGCGSFDLYVTTRAKGKTEP